MLPSLYRPLGRMERWLATRAELGVYTSVCAYARLGTGDVGGDGSDVVDSIKRRLVGLCHSLANLRLVTVERNEKAPQEFFDLGEIDPTNLPIEIKKSDALEENDRTAALESAIEALLAKPFPIIKLPGHQGNSLPDRPPVSPHKLRTIIHNDNLPVMAKWMDFLRWKLVVLCHASGHLDVALVYAHDIADGKSGLAMLKMIFDDEFSPFTDWKSVAPDCLELDKFPSAHPPVDAVARDTAPSTKKMLINAIKDLVPSIKRKFFLEKYYTGNNPPDAEKGQSVPSIAQVAARPTRIRLFELSAAFVSGLLEACRARGLKLHGLLVAAALIATANLGHRTSLRRPDLTLTGLNKQSSHLVIKCNTPVDLRANARLPISGSAFPIGAYVASVESTHDVPVPCASTNLWPLAHQSSASISAEAGNAQQLLGTISYIGDDISWHTFQSGNRHLYPSGRMESIMVSNVLTWTFPAFLNRSVRAGFTQDSEITGALIDLDVATVNGVLCAAANFREGIGGIEERDVEDWINEWKRLLDWTVSGQI